MYKPFLPLLQTSVSQHLACCALRELTQFGNDLLLGFSNYSKNQINIFKCWLRCLKSSARQQNNAAEPGVSLCSTECALLSKACPSTLATPAAFLVSLRPTSFSRSEDIFQKCPFFYYVEKCSPFFFRAWLFIYLFQSQSNITWVLF